MNSRFDNPFPYSDDNKRYHTYNYYLRHKFGTKVFKIPLNIDLGCPNRDGTKGVGGCVFCSAKMSGDFAGDPHEDILTQYREIREKMSKKWSNGAILILKGGMHFITGSVRKVFQKQKFRKTPDLPTTIWSKENVGFDCNGCYACI